MDQPINLVLQIIASRNQLHSVNNLEHRYHDEFEL